MDHSYSTEREKVQKTDHSYFTVAKKTPKVVLRKAQLMKDKQDCSRTSVGQDHSYFRLDHLLQLTSIIEADALYAGSEYVSHLPNKRALDDDNDELDVKSESPQVFHSASSSEPSSSSITPSDISIQTLPAFRCSYDLDEFPSRISDIRLDHTYNLRFSFASGPQCATSSSSLMRSSKPNITLQRNAVKDSCWKLHDHTYFGRTSPNIIPPIYTSMAHNV